MKPKLTIAKKKLILSLKKDNTKRISPKNVAMGAKKKS